MSISQEDFCRSCDAIVGVMARVYRKIEGSRITRFEIQFNDQSELPGDNEAYLTFKIWYIGEDEPRVIEHSKLINGWWRRDHDRCTYLGIPTD